MDSSKEQLSRKSQKARYIQYIQVLEMRIHLDKRKDKYDFAGFIDEYHQLCIQIDALLKIVLTDLTAEEIKDGLDEVPQVRSLIVTKDLQPTTSTHYTSLN